MPGSGLAAAAALAGHRARRRQAGEVQARSKPAEIPLPKPVARGASRHRRAGRGAGPAIPHRRTDEPRRHCPSAEPRRARLRRHQSREPAHAAPRVLHSRAHQRVPLRRCSTQCVTPTSARPCATTWRGPTSTDTPPTVSPPIWPAWPSAKAGGRTRRRVLRSAPVFWPAGSRAGQSQPSSREHNLASYSPLRAGAWAGPLPSGAVGSTTDSGSNTGSLRRAEGS